MKGETMRSLAKTVVAGAVLVAAVAGTGSVAAYQKKQDNRCDKYELIGGGWSWSQARADALSRGGRLATVSSVEESLCVNQALSGGSGWIGGSDLQTDREWRWDVPKNGLFWKGEYYDGRAYGYSNWSDGEPNGGTGENCLQASSGGWNDLNCGDGLNYVIRYP